MEITITHDDEIIITHCMIKSFTVSEKKEGGFDIVFTPRIADTEQESG